MLNGLDVLSRSDISAIRGFVARKLAFLIVAFNDSWFICDYSIVLAKYLQVNTGWHSFRTCPQKESGILVALTRFEYNHGTHHRTSSTCTSGQPEFIYSYCDCRRMNYR